MYLYSTSINVPLVLVYLVRYKWLPFTSNLFGGFEALLTLAFPLGPELQIFMSKYY